MQGYDKMCLICIFFPNLCRTHNSSSDSDSARGSYKTKTPKRHKSYAGVPNFNKASSNTRRGRWSIANKKRNYSSTFRYEDEVDLSHGQNHYSFPHIIEEDVDIHGTNERSSEHRQKRQHRNSKDWTDGDAVSHVGGHESTRRSRTSHGSGQDDRDWNDSDRSGASTWSGRHAPRDSGGDSYVLPGRSWWSSITVPPSPDMLPVTQQPSRWNIVLINRCIS